MGDLILLWVQRERAPLLTRRWIKLWAKRVLAGRGLLGIIWRRARLRWRGARIGNFSVISPSEIDGKLELLTVGNYSFVGRTHIALHEAVKIGNCVVVSDYVTVLTGTHSLSDPEWGLVALPVEIGDYAWIGQGATILPGVVIGAGAVVGAGSVVSRSVEPFTVVVGNPARAVPGKRPTDLRYVPVSKVAPFRAWLGVNDIRSPGTAGSD